MSLDRMPSSVLAFPLYYYDSTMNVQNFRRDCSHHHRFFPCSLHALLPKVVSSSSNFELVRKSTLPEAHRPTDDMCANANSPSDDGEHVQPIASHESNEALKVLAREIRAELVDLQANDAIHGCGKAPLWILHSRPAEALQLAKDQVQNQPYRDVRGCWLRLYEEASLHRAAEMIDDASKSSASTDWISPVVKMLDLGLIVSGALVRGELYEAVLANLRPFLEDSGLDAGIPSTFNVAKPEPLHSEHIVPSRRRPSLEAFQNHIDKQRTPLILEGVIDDWPAMSTWHRPAHMLRLTLGGRRCVPVEIGESYTHPDWRQEIMTFHKFMNDYLLLQQPEEIGYLGQHDLFHQIPALLREIITPDYCFSAPPEITPASRLGLPPVPPVDEPQKNVWLGPKGTRTPLHTDPYHNIFCQVLGYKYVRLYPPHATKSVYPRGVDENGINESNTSRVDLRLDRSKPGYVSIDGREAFPLFVMQTDYLEVMVGPGECLYIPAGWWHYIESLTASYSVSFWWN